jgi:hypothetical protein
MPINNFFNWKRFLRLLQHDFRINKKTYFWTLLGIALISFGINYVFLLSYKWNTKKFITSSYFFPFMLTIPIITYFFGTAFSELSNAIKAQNFLLLPASIFEKFLAQFIIRFLVFLPLMLLLFWSTTRLAKATLFTDGKAWEVQSHNYDALPLNKHITYDSPDYNTVAEINYQPSQVPDFHFEMLWDQSIDSSRVTLLLIWGFLFVSLFVVFAGTVYFKRFAVVKTLAVLGALTGCCVIATSYYNSYLISKVGMKEWQNGYSDYFVNTILGIKYGKIHPTLFIIWIGISAILLLGFSYFKLKEKEI